MIDKFNLFEFLTKTEYEQCAVNGYIITLDLSSEFEDFRTGKSDPAQLGAAVYLNITNQTWYDFYKGVGFKANGQYSEDKKFSLTPFYPNVAACAPRLDKKDYTINLEDVANGFKGIKNVADLEGAIGVLIVWAEESLASLASMNQQGIKRCRVLIEPITSP